MIAYNTGSIIVDKDLNLLDVDGQYSEFVCEGEENSLLANVLLDDQHLLYEMIEKIDLSEKEDVCFRLLNKSGEYRWVIAMCSKEKESADLNIRMRFQDISSLDEEPDNDDIDFGTGLLNKRAITGYVKKLCTNKNKLIHLCILDIDNFKHINDTKGHLFGDDVLREVAQIVRDTLGKGGKAGRIGGDELMLVIEKAENKVELRNYLRGIRENVEKTFKDLNDVPPVTVSIGAATLSDAVDDYQSLFNLADMMLYRAKSRGKNRYVIYTPDIHGTFEDGVLNENGRTAKIARPQDKARLVLDSIDGFFGSHNEAIPMVLMKILATYYLDEAYIFYRNLETSFTGCKKGSAPGTVEESVTDLLFVKEEELQKKFSSNGVLVIDRPEVQLKDTHKTREYFEKKNIKNAFLFKMGNEENYGYVFLFNTDQLSRKFPQTDVTDFTYLSKMIEVALKSR